ncbi:hypothetical protein, partial [Azospirillum isscasi]
MRTVSIKAVLPVIVGGLALLGLFTAGDTAIDSLRGAEAASAYRRVNEAAGRMVVAAGELALERGTSNGALNGPDPLPAERRARLQQRRD